MCEKQVTNRFEMEAKLTIYNDELNGNVKLKDGKWSNFLLEIGQLVFKILYAASPYAMAAAGVAGAAPVGVVVVVIVVVLSLQIWLERN